MAEVDQTLTVAILREIRADARKLQDLVLLSIESSRRRFDAIERKIEAVDRQVEDAASDIELMVKSELMGRLGNFETKIDRRIAETEDQFASQVPPK